MQSCTAAPGGTGGEQQRLPCESDSLLSTACSCPPLSGSPFFSTSAVLPEDISINGTGQSHGKVTSDRAPSAWDLPSCTGSTATTRAGNEENDSTTNPDLRFTDNGTLPNKSSSTSSHESALHGGSDRIDTNTVHSNHSTADTPGVQIEHNDSKDVASLRAQVRGGGECGDGNELFGISPSRRRADTSCWREGLLSFCSRDNCADDAASGAAENNDAESEESVQPRNFFPFNSIFAVAGWGSGAGWFFNSGGAFEPAADGSPDAAAGAASDSTVEQGPAGVYLPRFAAVPPSRKALPPLLSIGKRTPSQKGGSAEQGNWEQKGTNAGSSVVKGPVLLACPWHQQGARHSAQASTNTTRKRVDTSTRGPVSRRNAGLQRNSVAIPRRSPERSVISSGRSSLSQLTRSVGSVLWNCFCKLLRSRFNFISKSTAATAAASKAAKRIRRVPGISRLFREKAVEFALRDVSVGDVVRQWLSSLLYLSGKQTRGKPVFLGPVEANLPGRATAAAAAAAPKGHFPTQNTVDFAVSPLSTTTAGCDGSAHVFITPEAARLLWRSACSLIANPVTALYFQCYRLASLGAIVYVTSVVHWWQPQLGVRRTLDVLAVCIVSGIHIIVACVNAAPVVLLVYMLLCCAGVVCYLVGCSLAFRGFHLEAAVCHIGLHSLCTVGNVLLYYTISV